MSILLIATFALLGVYALWYIFLRPRRVLLHSSGPSGPHPPMISGPIPWVGCGIAFVFGPPQSYLQRLRRSAGDTFVLHMFGRSFLYVFSPSGVKGLYTLRENDASFAEATKGLLGLKLPSEVLDGDMRKFHSGLKKSLLQTYLTYIADAVDQELSVLRSAESSESASRFEVFALMRSIVHRVGFSCWIGSECCDSKYLPRLIRQFDELDPEQGFKSLPSLGRTIFTAKAREKRAIREMGTILREIYDRRKENKEAAADNLDNIVSIAREELNSPNDPRLWDRVACSVIQFHVASQANLYAAMSWSLISLLTRPTAQMNTLKNDLGVEQNKEESRRVRVNLNNLSEIEQGFTYLNDGIQESLRLAQQSITLRKVMKQCNIHIDGTDFVLPKGLFVATLLSITNVDEKYFGSDRITEFRPERYEKGALKESEYSGDRRYNISTFGHGYHSCPGYEFSMMALKYVMCRMVQTFRMEAEFERAQIPQSSIGAIARATHPCWVKYTPRRND